MSPRRLRLGGLRLRFVAAIVLVTVVTLAVTAVALITPLERRLRSDQSREVSADAVAQAATLERVTPALLRPGPALHQRLRRISRSVSAQVFLLDARGHVVGTTDPDQRGPFVPGLAAQRTGEVSTRVVRGDAGEEVQAAAAFRAGGRHLAVELHRPLDQVRASVRVVTEALVASALAGLLAALLVGIVVAGRLARRLRALRRTALQVARLGPIAEVPADDAARDEIGDLSRAFATMQRRLREQEEARRSFVATASHELRTPLASLRLMLDLGAEQLTREAPDVGAGVTQVRRAQDQAERLSRLADDLLELSRVDAGVALRRELVPLGELARSVLAEFEATDRGQGRTELREDGAEGAWAVGDPGAVARIVRILVDNALRFAPPGTAVRVTATTGARNAQVTVTDEGPGIPPEERETIFLRFRRGSATGGEGGFGLGLAIARELAERMGGTLRLDERAPSTTFVLTLEPAPAGAQSEPAPAGAA